MEEKAVQEGAIEDALLAESLARLSEAELWEWVYRCHRALYALETEAQQVDQTQKELRDHSQRLWQERERECRRLRAAQDEIGRRAVEGEG